MWRLFAVSLLGSSAAFAAEPESGLFCPLAVEPNAGLTETTDALQKRFLSVARERSGYALLLRKEAEEAVAGAKVADHAQSDASLSKVAVQGKVQNAGFVSLRLTDRNELMLQGRVVRADGKLLKASMLAVPRGTEPLLDVLATAAERFFDQLNGVTPPIAAATPVASGSDGKPPVAVVKPSTPPNPGTPLRILGAVLGGAGVATTVAGVVVFAGAGTVELDAQGNVSAVDAPRVKGIRAQQGAALGLLTAGAALAVTGLVMVLAAPNAPVTAAVAPRADGAVFVVEGSF
ncbi:MAG: hypothetical protein Q8L48_08555 [Archangium sp.]|nr:hypothetical protein [Archangium sp.]